MDKSQSVTHPVTMYSKLSDSELYSMYDQDTWFGLGENQRLSLLQETANREAIENGSKYSCNVYFADMPSDTSGYQSGYNIYLNREMFAQDKITAEYNGTTITYNLTDSNFDAYCTLTHEGRHVYQQAVTDGLIDTDALTKAAYTANGFTVSDINGEKGSHYLQGELDYSLYHMQPTEADAYKYSEAKTNGLVTQLSGMYGEKPSNVQYTQKMQSQSYETKLAGYQQLYNNPDVEKHIQNTLINTYYKTDLPTDKTIETIVQREMVLSQEYLDNQSKLKESTMTENNWQDMHVTREEFDSTLRGTVNSFYSHSMNQPGVSGEQAFAETAQVAEGYHNAMEEFDAAQQLNQGIPEDVPEIEAEAVDVTDIGVCPDSDMDNSADIDGGMDMDE